ncbi:hypothetical protein FGM00_17525 [Aggregatimonas sangjinii]|uniref:Uncharacterized protein n=1 Tax=Aggregatimonas sangjinii TaxID=2583587 RepID=A0A5B7SX18_9FLAO|nr:hypothetical protein [Aggregatimonas sangjinii]QCX01829.1 hypothetical protein FGM00_17525 [Aggregatimonas sangjinii]
MPKINPVVSFLLILLVALAGIFFTHITLLERFDEPKYGNLIQTSYLVNAALAAFIYLFLFIFQKKLKNYIGYLFIGGSFIKFTVFFILFYPVYRSDGEMDKLEFAAFFVPYAICLVIETVFTAKMLKKLDNNAL